MSDHVRPKDLYEWCRIPAEELAEHPNRRAPFRLNQNLLDLPV